MKWWVIISMLLIPSFVYAQSCGDHLHSTKHCKTVKLVKTDTLTPVSYKKVSGEHCFEHYENDVLQLMVTGRFENGLFMDGHEYVFDSIGLLEYILIYKDGKYAGNGIIEPSETETDTINQKTSEGKKDGYWVITGNMRNLAEYCDTCIIEEGEYILNRKNGVWIKYYPNGKIKSKITYKKGKAFGPYETFYEDGNLEEKGDFDPTIKYNVSSISPPYQGYWHKSTYEDANPPSKTMDTIASIEISVPNKSLADQCKGGDQFPEYDKCYNKNKDILLDGEFQGDTLYNGKYYIYDEYGLLERIAIFEKGKYVGDAVID